MENVSIVVLDYSSSDASPFDSWIIIDRKEDVEAGSTVLKVIPIHLSILTQFVSVQDLVFSDLSDANGQKFFLLDLIPAEKRPPVSEDAPQLDLSMLSPNTFAWRRVIHAAYNTICPCESRFLTDNAYDDHYAAFALADMLNFEFAKLLNAKMQVHARNSSIMIVKNFFDCELLVCATGLGIIKNAKATQLSMMRLYATLRFKCEELSGYFSTNKERIRNARLRNCLPPTAQGIDSEHYKLGSHAFSEIQTILFLSMMDGWDYGNYNGLIPSFSWYDPSMGRDMDNLIKFYLTKFPWNEKRHHQTRLLPLNLIVELEEAAKLFICSRFEKDKPVRFERPALKLGLAALGIGFSEIEIDNGTDPRIFKVKENTPPPLYTSVRIVNKTTEDRVFAEYDPTSWTDFMEIIAVGKIRKQCWAIVYEQYSFRFKPYKL